MLSLGKVSRYFLLRQIHPKRDILNLYFLYLPLIRYIITFKTSYKVVVANYLEQPKLLYCLIQVAKYEPWLMRSFVRRPLLQEYNPSSLIDSL